MHQLEIKVLDLINTLN